jgi:DNA-binding transcriptional regulator YhcF (GntR family)
MLKTKPSKRTAKAPVIPLASAAVSKLKSNASKDLAQRWGAEAIRAGWVALPSIILEKQHALSLEPIDINIILQIAKHWFDAGKLPHPSKGSIAKSMNVSPRTVQKHVAKLEGLGFIKRIARYGARGSQSSQFDFAGLALAIEPFAKEALKQREEKRKLKLEQLRRRKPQVTTPDDDADSDVDAA